MGTTYLDQVDPGDSCDPGPVPGEVDIQAAAVETVDADGPALDALPWTSAAVTMSEEGEVEHCVFASDGLPVATVLGCPDAPEVARLIAAAPGLLAACEAALDVIEACGHPRIGEVMAAEQLRDAIAKARG